MRKKLKYLLFLLLLLPFNVMGMSVSISCSSRGEVYVGDTFDVTIYGSASEQAYWQSDYVNSSGNIRSNSGVGEVFSDSPSASISKTYSFTALSEGTATVNQSFMVSDEAGNDGSYSSDTCYINIIQPTSPAQSNSSVSSNISGIYIDVDDPPQGFVDESLSNNNYLKSLTIDKIKMNPDFNKEKTEYSAMVDGSTEKVTINAEKEDEKATITGTGEKELKEGLNRFEIEVTAENGEKRVYVVNITRKEIDPIEVIINKKKYTILKQEGSIKVPEGFKKTTIKIDKQDVVAYKNDTIGYTIIALVDQNGKASWFIYNEKNSTYSKYNELNVNGTKIILLEPKKEDIPHKYFKVDFSIGSEVFPGYALEYNSPFRLVYGLNITTGSTGFYLYDTEDNTIQRFYNVQVEVYRGLLKKVAIVGIGLISLIIILLIIIVCQIILKRKIKRFVANPKEQDDDLSLYKEELEEDKKESKEKEEKKAKKEFNKTMKIELEDEYQEQELSKKEIKQKKKDEKKMLKEERKNFLD